MELAERTAIDTKLLLRYAAIPHSKYYDWKKRYSIATQHNGKVPRASWLLEEEKQSIIGYAKNHMEEGYRRLTYMMIDEDIALRVFLQYIASVLFVQFPMNQYINSCL